jgi:hypothetical protein
MCETGRIKRQRNRNTRTRRKSDEECEEETKQ